MTKEQYERNSGEYLKFDRVKNRTSGRPDLHAFNLLDLLIPGVTDIVSAAEHDKIWLDIEPKTLSAAATEDQIIELIRCGVRYDKYVDRLTMYV